MKIETKFEVGQTVYVVGMGIPVPRKIERIEIQATTEGVRIEYCPGALNEKWLVGSKEEWRTERIASLRKELGELEK
jgi:hypothetical protein